MPDPAVCVVGSLTMDVVVSCDDLPGPGQTVFGRSLRTTPGGRGLRQAIAAARAGAAVSLVGRVGRDATGRELRALLPRERIDAIGVAESWSAPTGASAISVDARGEHTSVVVPGANEQLEPGYVEESSRRIEGARVLLTQLEIPKPAVVRAAEIARGAGVRVVLNVAPAQSVPREVLGLVDVAVLNTHEACTLTGVERDGETLERALTGLGVPVVVLTKGSEGATVLAPSGRSHVPAHPIEVLDTTGAGDAFIGALGARWAALAPEGATPGLEALPEALRFASAAGSVATTRRESVASLPNIAEIEALLAESADQRTA